jgi:hypothetical protein
VHIIAQIEDRNNINMRILICGGRDFTDKWKFYEVMDRLSEEYDFDNKQPIVIIAGEARGADTLAKEYAEECWEYAGYPADWNKYGKRAGYVRNQQMLDEGKPELVVAFPGGKGTAMMIELAKKAGVEVIEVTN